MDEEKICQNCAHWDAAHAVKLPVYNDKGKLVDWREFAACKVNAVTVEAGECLPMMGAEGHCQWHEEEFEPTADFLAYIHESKTANDGLPLMQLEPAEVRRVYVA